MTDQQIHQLANSSCFFEKYGKVKLVTTHISYVLLAQEFVFKIKKPHHFSFLDFSTLSKRKYYCGQELKLNQRLAPEMYLLVVPISQKGDDIYIEAAAGEIIDYAVKMKRMDEGRQMNLLLERKEVTNDHLDAIADKVAAFHKKAYVIKKAQKVGSLHNDFADILMIKDFISEEIGRKMAAMVGASVDFSSRFLAAHSHRIKERHEKGFTVDGHGDLYSQNIFLPQNGQPVIFDCIEFSDHLRHLDVLNELAFFCMDLDYYGRVEMGIYFLKKYNEANPCIFNDEDQLLFNYYKLYRANVRAKVGALKAMQMKKGEAQGKQLKFVGDYLCLMERYLGQLAAVRL